MNIICENDRCTGCSACASICPIHCITMEEDSEGFDRPVIDQNKCIHCGLCKKTCPINSTLPDSLVKPKTYAIQNNLSRIRKMASSGGVFPLLAKKVIDLGGVVFGAGFDENFNIVHKAAYNWDDLIDLFGSKYVQSRIGSTYSEAKMCLESGRVVLFTGTPCQIGGLYRFLGKNYENLYTQDLICHGVPSPKMWSKYLSYRSDAIGEQPISVKFRDKTYGWKYYSLSVNFSNGKYYIQKNVDDPYLKAFIMNMALRPSCEKCCFKQIHRLSDITLADFWGIEDVLPSWDVDGTSLVMTHSIKGERLLSQVISETKYEVINFDIGIKSNPSMTHSVSHNPLRKKFLKDLDKISFDKLYKKYCADSFCSKMRRRVAYIVGRIERLYEK